MAVTTETSGSITQADYDNVKETFPVSTAGAGTVSTVNSANLLVSGSGTAFTTAVNVGDWIWFKTADELAEVASIVSDTELYLKASPGTTATGDTYGVVPKMNYKSVSFMIDADGVADVNRITYPADTTNVFSSGKPNTSGGGRRLDPLLIDSTASTNNVYVSAQ
jgi:hypothetical protein